MSEDCTFYPVAEYVAGVNSGMISRSHAYECSYTPAWLSPKGEVVAVSSHEQFATAGYQAEYDRGFLRLTIEIGFGALGVEWYRATPTDAQVEALRQLQADLNLRIGFYTTDRKNASVNNEPLADAVARLTGKVSA